MPAAPLPLASTRARHWPRQRTPTVRIAVFFAGTAKRRFYFPQNCGMVMAGHFFVQSILFLRIYVLKELRRAAGACHGIAALRRDALRRQARPQPVRFCPVLPGPVRSCPALRPAMRTAMRTVRTGTRPPPRRSESAPRDLNQPRGGGHMCRQPPKHFYCQSALDRQKAALLQGRFTLKCLIFQGFH